MARELKPCGTSAAYRRHLRNGEQPCAACRRANTEAKRQRFDSDFLEPDLPDLPDLVDLSDAEPVAPGMDELDDARYNLGIVIAAMKGAQPSSIAALSKRRQELASAITKLEAGDKPKEADKPKETDEVSERRERRERRARRRADTA